MKKTFYRAWLCADEEGLRVRIDKWVSIHETPCMHFCVPEWRVFLPQMTRQSQLQYAKERKMLKRIHKGSSRFAFETVEDAIENLRYRKRKQLNHLRREIEFAEAFLNGDIDKRGDLYFVPGTKDLVHEFYNFDY